MTHNTLEGCYFNQDCIFWDLKFYSVHGELNQFEIFSNDGTFPDVTANPLVGQDVTTVSLELAPRGPNVMYEAIPFEMLRTAHESPQIQVKIDGIPAICTCVACDYTYEAVEGLITDFSVNGLDITILGSNLPLEFASVKLAYTNCEVTSNSASSIGCTLVTPWVSGDWIPAVRDVKGLIPVASSV